MDINPSDPSTRSSNENDPIKARQQFHQQRVAGLSGVSRPPRIDTPVQPAVNSSPPQVERQVKQPNIDSMSSSGINPKPVQEISPATTTNQTQNSSVPKPLNLDTEAQTPSLSDIKKQQKPKMRRRLAIFSLIMAALFLGGSAYAYFGVYIPNQPQNRIAKALDKLFKADSFQFSVYYQFDQIDDEADPLVLRVVGSTKTDVSKFDIKTIVDYGEYIVELQTKHIDNNLYFKLNGLSDILNAVIDLSSGETSKIIESLLASGVLESVEDNWYQITANDVGRPDDILFNIPESDLQKIYKLIDEYQIIQQIETLPDDVLNDRKIVGYKIQANTAQIEPFTQALKEADFETLSFDDLKASGATAETEDLPTLEFWVYDDNSTLAMIKTSLADEVASGELSLGFNGYNEELEFEAPENYKSVTTLLPDILQSIGLDGLGAEF